MRSTLSKGALVALALIGSTMVPGALTAAVADALPDKTGPVGIFTGNLGERVVSTTAAVPVHLSWGFSDNPAPGERSGAPARTDVRYQVDGSPDFVLPPEWQGMANGAPQVDDVVPLETGRCYSARATDDSGNTGPWTTPVCRYADGAPPVLAPDTGVPEFTPQLSTRLRYSYAATDPGGVHEFDIGVRTASSGHSLSSWTSPTEYSHLTGSYNPMPVSGAGRSYCFRVRAHDTAGHVSGWSTGLCTALPTDDRSFVRIGRTTRSRSGLAVAGTYTTLTAKGAAVSTSSQTGRKVGLWLLRGPGQGSVDVYAGGRRIGRTTGVATRTQRVLVTFPVAGTFTGAVKVVRTGTRPVRVDAIAVAR